VAAKGQTVTSRLLGRVRRRQGERTDVIDLRDRPGDALWAEGSQTPEEAAEAEQARRERLEAWQRRRSRAEEQREAEIELQRLRRQHWSGERLLEEGKLDQEWWELPDADPYAVLGLLPGASLAEASTARRAIAHQCHPDALAGEGALAPDDERVRRMRAANAAFARLRRVMNPQE
jgi:hypothetical protein